MTRCATRCASVSVLPEPAPAMTSSGRAVRADAVLHRRALVGIELFQIVHANHEGGGVRTTNHVSPFVRKCGDRLILNRRLASVVAFRRDA